MTGHAYRIILVIVLFVTMVFLTVDFAQQKHTQDIGNGNRELLCVSIELRLAAEANHDPRLTDAYHRDCADYAP